MNTCILYWDEEGVVVRAEEGGEEGLLVGREGGGRREREEEEEEILTRHHDGQEITELVEIPPIELDLVIEMNCNKSGNSGADSLATCWVGRVGSLPSNTLLSI